MNVIRGKVKEIKQAKKERESKWTVRLQPVWPRAINKTQHIQNRANKQNRRKPNKTTNPLFRGERENEECVGLCLNYCHCVSASHLFVLLPSPLSLQPYLRELDIRLNKMATRLIAILHLHYFFPSFFLICYRFLILL